MDGAMASTSGCYRPPARNFADSGDSDDHDGGEDDLDLKESDEDEVSDWTEEGEEEKGVVLAIQPEERCEWYQNLMDRIQENPERFPESLIKENLLYK